MADSSTAPARVRFLEWIPLAGFIIVIIGLIFAAGGRDRQLADHDRRIDQLEQHDVARSDTISKIDVRTVRVEAKLDFIIGEKGNKP